MVLTGEGVDSTMIQDIAPDRLNNAYQIKTPEKDDFVFFFDEEGRMLVRNEAGRIVFPTVKDSQASETVYLFSVNETGYYLAHESVNLPPAYVWRSVRELRDMGSGSELFSAFTAYHLWKWYRDNRFCGRCGGPNRLHPTERALVCTRCGHTIYPRINPAVIVGVIRDDCLLITRYRTGYAHNALVAGFTEIGETLEETVRREVMEETGVKVKNIRYYKSQPWGMAEDLLMGFYCDADGDGEICMDENELKYAEWVRRDEIVLQPNALSLTNEMMQQFKQHKQ